MSSRARSICQSLVRDSSLKGVLQHTFWPSKTHVQVHDCQAGKGSHLGLFGVRRTSPRWACATWATPSPPSSSRPSCPARWRWVGDVEIQGGAVGCVLFFFVWSGAQEAIPKRGRSPESPQWWMAAAVGLVLVKLCLCWMWSLRCTNRGGRVHSKFRGRRHDGHNLASQFGHQSTLPALTVLYGQQRSPFPAWHCSLILFREGTCCSWLAGLLARG